MQASDDDGVHGTPPPTARTKPEMTSDQVKQIISQLISQVKHDHPDHKLKTGVLAQVANNFNIHVRTVSRIWKKARQNFNDPHIAAFRCTPQKKKCGRKSKYNRDEIRAAVITIPPHRKRTLRSLSSAIGIPLTSLHRMKLDKDDPVILPHSNAIKPLLTETHKLARVYYCMSKVNLETNEIHDFYDSVHVDEKWFFISEASLRMYLAPGEEPPQRAATHKSHILKVMFLVATARPRYDANGICTFDGKIGCWPFVETVLTQRASVNRPAGTLETKNVSVSKAKYREFMIEKVLPAIKEKWPDRNKDITIQQDGAPTHIRQDDPAFVVAATQGSWNITLETQAAQSPDTNHLDLTFFRSLQARQWDHGYARNTDELIVQVQSAYQEFNPRKIDFGFLTLQCCINEILECQGDNKYSIPHMAKESLLRRGELPERIIASAAAVNVMNALLGIDE